MGEREGGWGGGGGRRQTKQTAMDTDRSVSKGIHFKPSLCLLFRLLLLFYFFVVLILVVDILSPPVMGCGVGG